MIKEISTLHMSPGLYEGLAGYCLANSYFGKDITLQLNELCKSVKNGISDISFENGLTGISYVLGELMKRRTISSSFSEIQCKIDDAIFRKFAFSGNEVDLSYSSIIHICKYLMDRLEYYNETQNMIFNGLVIHMLDYIFENLSNIRYDELLISNIYSFIPSILLFSAKMRSKYIEYRLPILKEFLCSYWPEKHYARLCFLCGINEIEKQYTSFRVNYDFKSYLQAWDIDEIYSELGENLSIKDGLAGLGILFYMFPQTSKARKSQIDRLASKISHYRNHNTLNIISVKHSLYSGTLGVNMVLNLLKTI